MTTCLDSWMAFMEHLAIRELAHAQIKPHLKQMFSNKEIL